jgi:hypothetical protein
MNDLSLSYTYLQTDLRDQDLEFESGETFLPPEMHTCVPIKDEFLILFGGKESGNKISNKVFQIFVSQSISIILLSF